MGDNKDPNGKWARDAIKSVKGFVDKVFRSEVEENVEGAVKESTVDTLKKRSGKAGSDVRRIMKGEY